MSQSTLLVPGNLVRHGKKEFDKNNNVVPINYIMDFINSILVRADNHVLPFMFLLAPTGAGKTIE